MRENWAKFIVLDDDKRDAENIRTYLMRLFHEINLDIEVEILEKPDQILPALNTHPDFFIIDVSLLGENDHSGLSAIQKYKPKFPHVTFVAVTMEIEQLSNLTKLVIQPDFIISKMQMHFSRMPVDGQGQANFEENVRNYFICNRIQNRNLKISINTDVEKSIKSNSAIGKYDKGLVHSLIRQCFSSFNFGVDHNIFYSDQRVNEPVKLYLDESIDRIKVDPFIMGLSNSCVFLSKIYNSKKQYPVHAVIKIGKIDDYYKEISNFTKYVKWMLPYAWRVDILGTGISQNLGMIAYSLAFAGQADSVPLSKYSTSAFAEPILTFIATIFDPNNRTWYAEAEIITEPRHLTSELFGRYFQADRDRIQNQEAMMLELVEQAAEFAEIYPDQRQSEIVGKIRKKLRRLVEPGELGYKSCICHGDLHLDNIMTNEVTNKTEFSPENQKFVFIDFQDTGRFHVSTDFVVFETSIRKDSNFDEEMTTREYYEYNLDQFKNFEKILDDQQAPKENTYLEIVTNLRRQYLSNFGTDSSSHYILHLLIFTYFLLDSDTLAYNNRSRMLGLFCAALDYCIED